MVFPGGAWGRDRLLRWVPLVLGLSLLVVTPAFAEELPMGTIRGRLRVPDGQECRGVVSLWDGGEARIPDPRRYLIIPFNAVNLRASCDFELQAPAGDYYLGALARTSPGPEIGPPRPGDLVFMTPDAEGGALQVKVVPGTVLEVGTQDKFWRYAGMEAALTMGITGSVLDAAGKPVAGVLVFAFADREMTRRPLAVSARTGADGRYQLRLDQPGVVYLRVKDDYRGGAPVDGGYVGVFGGETPTAVDIGPAVVASGLDIAVFKVPAGRLRRRGPASTSAGER